MTFKNGICGDNIHVHTCKHACINIHINNIQTDKMWEGDTYLERAKDPLSREMAPWRTKSSRLPTIRDKSGSCSCSSSSAAAASWVISVLPILLLQFSLLLLLLLLLLLRKKPNLGITNEILALLLSLFTFVARSLSLCALALQLPLLLHPNTRTHARTHAWEIV